MTSSLTIIRKDEILRKWPNEQCTKLTCEGLKKQTKILLKVTRVVLSK